MSASKNVRFLNDNQDTDHQRMRSETTNSILDVLKEKPPEDAIKTIKIKPAISDAVTINDIKAPIPTGSKMYQPASKPTVKLDDRKDEKKKQNRCCN